MTNDEKSPAHGGEMPPVERAAITGSGGIDTVRGATPADNAAQERNTNAAALDRDIAHLIDCSESGIARVPRETLVRLRTLLTSPRAAVPAPEGWKLVPIERSYNMRAKALIAFNTTEKKTNDRDDALDAAHRAMLDAAPAAPVAEAASQGVIAAALAVIECDRAQVLTDAHIDALDNAIKIQRGEVELPPAAQAVAAPVAEPANVDLALIVAALEHSKPTHDHYPEARERHRKALESARMLVAGDQAVAADGAAQDDLLQLDVLLAALHEAVWEAGSNAWPAYDIAGKDEAKAIQRHVRAMLAEREAVSPATADRIPDECAASGGSCSYAPDGRHGEMQCRYCGKEKPATAGAPLNGIAATMFHGEGAIARCSYCGRYSLDRKTLGDRPPKCKCGEKHGWSGSFEKPGPDAKWSGAAPSGMPTTADERAALREMLDDARNEFTMVREALGVAYEPHQTLLERTLDAARTSQAAAPQANAADARTALRWTAGTLQEIVSGRWKGAKESDKVSIGAVTKTVAQVLDMADAALGVASQAAAPADARSLLRKAHRTLACAALTQIRDGEAVWTEIGRFLDAAPAEAREPVAYTSRARLQKLASNPEHVETMWGVGLISKTGNVALYDGPVSVPADAGEAALTAAARDVLAERARQVSVEGWTPARDDQYTNGELAQAASLYAVSELKRGDPPLMWPWHANWWKPTTPRRNRVKAAALLIADIERLDRAEAREQGAQGGKGGEA